MLIDNYKLMFDQVIRVSELDLFSEDAVWPFNVQVCITRVPARKKDGWSQEMFDKFALKLKSSMARNGSVFLIVYAPSEQKSRPFDIVNSMVRAGFTHVDNIVIKKTWFTGKRSGNTLVNSHEFVLQFCNGDVWKLDREPIFDLLGLSPKEMSCPGNTWEVDMGSLDESYPEFLAETLINMTRTLPGEVVFDPFGGGTGGLKAAIKLGLSYYSFEKNKKVLSKIKNIIENLNSQEQP